MGRDTGLDMVMHTGESLAFDIGIDGEIDGSVTAAAMTVRRKVSFELLFRLTLGSGITADNGVYHVVVPSSATASALPGSCDYTVEFTITKNSVAKVYMPLWGTLNLLDGLGTYTT